MRRVKKFFGGIFNLSRRDGDAGTSRQGHMQSGQLTQPASLTTSSNVVELSQPLVQPVSTNEAVLTLMNVPLGQQGDANSQQVEQAANSFSAPPNWSPLGPSTIPIASKIPDRGGQKFGLFPMNLNAKGLATTRLQGSDIASEAQTSPVETYPIDIVAIHGITGDAYNTWRHENGKLWLSDFLNDDLPGARIFSYGYDAGVFFSFGDGGYDQFARTLLASVNQTRTSEASKRRPLIFICHSMGGIIVKQAIITSILRSDLYGNIRASCFGIIFLGTPHQGSKETGLPKMIAAMTNVAMLGTSRLFGRARTELIAGLDREAPALDKISRDFVQQTTTVKIASFIEQDITPPAKTRIVDGISGEMKVPGEQVIDMQGCDHKSICRFSNRNNNYDLVRNVLLGWCSSMQPQEAASQDHLPVAESISSLQFRGLSWRRWQLERLELEERSYHKTCTWIFSCDSYCRWLNQPKGILWIEGKPGAGKSTIMKTLVGRFEREPEGHVVLAFFFDAFGDPDIRLRNSAGGMYRTLLLQLLQQVPSAAFRFQGIYEKRKLLHPKRDQPVEWEDEEQNLLKKFLMDELEKLERPSAKIRIFVDAIDEAVQDTAGEIVRYLYDLDKRLRRNGMDVRVCISSRHFPVTKVRRHHSIIMENENSEDIASYVEREFETREILRRRRLDQTGALSELRQQIIEKASGIFLWVSLIIEIVIDRLNAGDSTVQVLARMKLPPPGLGKIYADMLRNVVKKEDRSDAYFMLRWAVRTNEPLLLGRLANEVKWTYPFSPSQSSEDDQEELLDRMVLCVGSYSGGLMETEYHDVPESTTTVVFIHQTVRTFLKEGGLKTFRDELLIPWSRDSSSSSSSVDEDEGSDTSGRSPRASSSLSRAGDSFQSSQSQSTGKQAATPKSNQLQTLLSSEEGTIDLHRPSSQKFLPADQWFENLERVTRQFHSQGTKDRPRVKIAIIDTGIDLSHDWFRHDNNVLISDSSWPELSVANNIDYHGSGTYHTGLISKVAPHAELYIAKVDSNVPFGQQAKGRSTFEGHRIAEAINWAVEKGVDIISMSFGFESDHYEIAQAIRKAKSKNIIMFAAAGMNGSSSKIAFPARASDVITIYSADGHGSPSAFNPELSESGGNFSILGEGVESSWPLSLEGGSTKRLSGTSVATAIAAGLAALLLDFLRENPSHMPPEKLSRLTSPDAIRLLFRYMSSSRGSYGNVVPWKLLSSKATHEQIETTIERIISEEERSGAPEVLPSKTAGEAEDENEDKDVQAA